MSDVVAEVSNRVEKLTKEAISQITEDNCEECKQRKLRKAKWMSFECYHHYHKLCEQNYYEEFCMCPHHLEARLKELQTERSEKLLTEERLARAISNSAKNQQRT